MGKGKEKTEGAVQVPSLVAPPRAGGFNGCATGAAYLVVDGYVYDVDPTDIAHAVECFGYRQLTADELAAFAQME